MGKAILGFHPTNPTKSYASVVASEGGRRNDEVGLHPTLMPCGWWFLFSGELGQVVAAAEGFLGAGGLDAFVGPQ
ncbi:hypothetical protein U1Q18_021887 [Sarracenia purpurea var. burkii]